MRATFRTCASALRVGVRSLLLALPAHADSYAPDQEFTVGPTLAWGLGAELIHELCVMLELTTYQ